MVSDRHCPSHMFHSVHPSFSLVVACKLHCSMSETEFFSLCSRTSFSLVSYVCLGDSEVSLSYLFISIECVNQFYPLIDFYRREADSARVVVQSASTNLEIARTSMHWSDELMKGMAMLKEEASLVALVCSS